MAKAVMNTCRVCGKQYKACASTIRTPYSTGNRWQEVACSPECGAEYFRRIEEARAPKVGKEKPKKKEHVAMDIVDKFNELGNNEAIDTKNPVKEG